MKILSYIASFVLGLTFWYYPTFDPDLGWHLFGGDYILQNGFPSSDPINTFNTFWLDYHWLAQVFLSKIYSLGGFELLRFVLGISMGLMLIIINACVYSASKDRIQPCIAFLITATICLLLSNNISVRPQTWSILMLFASLLILLKEYKFELPILFLITVILVNVHVYWVIVPLLWVIFRIIARFLDEKKFSSLYVYSGFIFLISAGFFSPYGILAEKLDLNIPFGILGNYVLLFEYAFTPADFKNMINEFKSGLSGTFPAPVIMLLISGVFIRALSKEFLKRNWILSLALIIGICLGIKSIKFIPIAALLSVPFLSSYFANLTVSKFISNFVLIVPSLIFSFLAFYLNPWSYNNDYFISENLPVRACEQISNLNLSPSSGREHIRIMTHFDHGGWCRWAAYQKDKNLNIKVTTDGRTQFISPDFLMEGFDLYRVKFKWLETLQKWDPDIVVTEINWALGQMLYYWPSKGDWELVYKDGTFAMFKRNR